LYGGVTDGPWYVELMRGKVDVSPFRDQIIFGRAFAEQASASVPQTALAVLPDRDGAEAATGLQWQTA
jgi:NAD(P)H-nitrite reductase large subunit